jgi:hypothetical protein
MEGREKGLKGNETSSKVAERMEVKAMTIKNRRGLKWARILSVGPSSRSV